MPASASNASSGHPTGAFAITSAAASTRSFGISTDHGVVQEILLSVPSQVARSEAPLRYAFVKQYFSATKSLISTCPSPSVFAPLAKLLLDLGYSVNPDLDSISSSAATICEYFFQPERAAFEAIGVFNPSGGSVTPLTDLDARKKQKLDHRPKYVQLKATIWMHHLDPDAFPESFPALSETFYLELPWSQRDPDDASPSSIIDRPDTVNQFSAVAQRLFDESITAATTPGARTPRPSPKSPNVNDPASANAERLEVEALAAAAKAIASPDIARIRTDNEALIAAEPNSAARARKRKELLNRASQPSAFRNFFGSSDDWPANYYGSWDFCETSTLFVNTFGSAQPPTYKILHGTGFQQSQDATPFPKTYRRVFAHLLEQRLLNLFVADKDLGDMSSAVDHIFTLLKREKMVQYPPASSSSKLTWIISPMELLQRLNHVVPLLNFESNDPAEWPMTLPQVFWEALSNKFRSAVRSTLKNKIPKPSTLRSYALQHRALTVLAQAAEAEFIDLRNKGIYHGTVKPSTSPAASQFSTKVPPDALTAPVLRGDDILEEAKRRRHADSDSDPPSAPAYAISAAEQTIRAQRGTEHPVDPVTKFRSRFPSDFRGCLLCGDTNHIFSSCPHKETFGARVAFRFEMNARYPEKRRSQTLTPTETVFLSTLTSDGTLDAFPPGTTLISFIKKGTFSTAYKASNPSTTPATNERPNPYTGSGTAQYVTSVYHSEPRTKSDTRPIPVTIAPGSLCVEFAIGSPELTRLGALADTGGALNTGNILRHEQIAKDFPDAVESFVYCNNDSDPFTPLRLTGAIDEGLVGSVTPDFNLPLSLRGQLIAVVTYRTPYLNTNGQRVLLSFALGHDIKPNTLLGLPFWQSLKSTFDLSTMLVTCKGLSGHPSLPLSLKPLPAPPTPSPPPMPTKAVTFASDTDTNNSRGPRGIDNSPAWMSRQPTEKCETNPSPKAHADTRTNANSGDHPDPGTTTNTDTDTDPISTPCADPDPTADTDSSTNLPTPASVDTTAAFFQSTPTTQHFPVLRS